MRYRVIPLGEVPVPPPGPWRPLSGVAKTAVGLLLLAGVCYIVAIRGRVV